MIHERRKGTTSSHSTLPVDYTRMVNEVFTTNFSDTLDAMALEPRPVFLSGGEIYADEIVVHVALVQEGRIAATSVYASTDFDPKASAPTIEDLLTICVDGVGEVMQTLCELAAKQDEKDSLLSSSLNELAESGPVPQEWTQIEVSKRKIFVRADKTNPAMDAAADEWLAKHDPEFLKNEEKNAKSAEKLFVLPPDKSGSQKPGASGTGQGGGTLH
jgi:hypothetical protein